MQIIFVGTVMSAGMELLRVVPIVQALVRRFVGPQTTEKDRQTTFMGIRPLCDPLEFEHADFASQSVSMVDVELMQPADCILQRTYAYDVSHSSLRDTGLVLYGLARVHSHFTNHMLRCCSLLSYNGINLSAPVHLYLPNRTR